MYTGATVIKHDSETVPVDECRNDRLGCLNRTILYQVPTRQIVALSRQSLGCHQKLEFEVRIRLQCYVNAFNLMPSSSSTVRVHGVAARLARLFGGATVRTHHISSRSANFVSLPSCSFN